MISSLDYWIRILAPGSAAWEGLNKFYAIHGSVDLTKANIKIMKSNHHTKFLWTKVTFKERFYRTKQLIKSDYESKGKYNRRLVFKRQKSRKIQRQPLLKRIRCSANTQHLAAEIKKLMLKIHTRFLLPVKGSQKEVRSNHPKFSLKASLKLSTNQIFTTKIGL